MNKLAIITVFAALLAAPSAQSQSPTPKQAEKERKETVKIARKRLNEKANKDARKQAKDLKKEGWKVTAGAMPIDKQLDAAQLMAQETDANGTKKYVWGTAITTAENIDAAFLQGRELAKLSIVQQIEQDVTMAVKNAVANSQMTQGEAASITQTIINSRSLIQTRMGSVEPVVELYRTLPNGNKEVQVRVAYSRHQFIEATKAAIRSELKKESKDLDKNSTAS